MFQITIPLKVFLALGNELRPNDSLVYLNFYPCKFVEEDTTPGIERKYKVKFTRSGLYNRGETAEMMAMELGVKICVQKFFVETA